MEVFVAEIENFDLVVLIQILNTRLSSLLLSPKQMGESKKTK